MLAQSYPQNSLQPMLEAIAGETCAGLNSTSAQVYIIIITIMIIIIIFIILTIRTATTIIAGRTFHLFLADPSSPLASPSPSSSSPLSSSSSPSSSAASSSGSPSSTWSGRETSCQAATTKEEDPEEGRLWRTPRPPRRHLFWHQTPPLVFLSHHLPPTTRPLPTPPHPSWAPNPPLLSSLRHPTPCSSDHRGLVWQGVTQRTTADTESPGKTPPIAERRGNYISALSIITEIWKPKVFRPSGINQQLKSTKNELPYTFLLQSAHLSRHGWWPCSSDHTTLHHNWIDQLLIIE